MSIHRNLIHLAVAIGCLAFSSTLFAQQAKLRLALAGSTEPIRCVAISPDGKTIASGGGDNLLRFWDVEAGKEVAALKVAQYLIDSVAFSPDGKTLAVGGGGNKIMLFDVATRTSITTLYDRKSQYAKPMVVFSPDGKTLVSGGTCINEIKLWDVENHMNIANLKGFSLYGVRAMLIAPDNQTLLAVGHHGGVKQWDVATGLIKKATLNEADTERIAKLIRALGDENFANRDKAAKELEAIGPMAIDMLKQARNDNDAEVGERAAKLVDLLGEHGIAAHHVHHAAFSADAKLVAAARRAEIIEVDGQNVVKEPAHVRLWDVATGRELAALKTHTAEVNTLAFSPDGKILATGSDDKTIKLWDTTTGKELATLKEHTEHVESVSFRADGKFLVSGSKDKSIKLWELTPGK